MIYLTAGTCIHERLTLRSSASSLSFGHPANVNKQIALQFHNLRANAPRHHHPYHRTPHQMARLNEPPGTGAPDFESLKRRFIRQNRDLARSNSNQSIKLRQQESEIAHLLSENASLRQRILQLENDLASSSSDDLRHGVDAVRAHLEHQLANFVQSVNGCLEDLSASSQVKKSRRKSQLATSPKRSPARREWKNSSTLCEALASQGQTMPTIVENKLFPRRTLDAEDAERQIRERALQLHDDESPKLAPPVTFLDRAADTETHTEDAAAPTILGSVEIRRRRRQSSLLDGDDKSAHPLKAGAKRKLDFTDSNERHEPARAPLGEKSVNTDPVVSPRKQSAPDTTSPTKNPPLAPPSLSPSKPAPVPRRATRTASTTSHGPRIKVEQGTRRIPKPDEQPTQTATAPPPSTNVPEIKPEPLTPSLPTDMLSPSTTTTSPSHSRAPTPPPEARATRRSRPAVSYAEPKINVKMRRPGKELTDAVASRPSLERDGPVKQEESRSPPRLGSSTSLRGGVMDASAKEVEVEVGAGADVFDPPSSSPPSLPARLSREGGDKIARARQGSTSSLKGLEERRVRRSTLDPSTSSSTSTAGTGARTATGARRAVNREGGAGGGGLTRARSTAALAGSAEGSGGRVLERRRSTLL